MFVSFGLAADLVGVHELRLHIPEDAIFSGDTPSVMCAAPHSNDGAYLAFPIVK